MAMISRWYFSYSAKYDWTASARSCAEDTKVFSLTARIVLKDDPALAHELARLCEKVKVERSIVQEGFFIFKGQQLMVDNNCDVSSAYVAILCQFHRYVTISRQEYFGGTLQFFNKTTKKSISARSIELCNISNKTVALEKLILNPKPQVWSLSCIVN